MNTRKIIIHNHWISGKARYNLVIKDSKLSNLRQEEYDESNDNFLILSGRKIKLPMEHSVNDLIVAEHPESHLMPGVNGIIEQKTGPFQNPNKDNFRDNVRELNEKMENLQVQPQVQPGRFSRGKFLWSKYSE